ncbi:hypothetical protein RHSIM_Rhsim08G0091000 [Rhododendron simsii]|uniref:Phytosulfokine n=1 Tax=Rhododendron simsii TaxID=118357 RepID=A0A834LGA7_RHOSS|nr:hypothetical protein RHSIM_Rhsim08G0091000 [Rhododendron simsii]
MSTKLITLFTLVLLLLCSTLSYAARPAPNPLEHYLVLKLRNTEVVVEESCEGVGDEECLMRRTPAAHVDYIYTQKLKPDLRPRIDRQQNATQEAVDLLPEGADPPDLNTSKFDRAESTLNYSNIPQANQTEFQASAPIHLFTTYLCEPKGHNYDLI